MVDSVTIVRERQLVIRREMDRRGISLKAVSLDSGIPYPTVTSYFPGERDRQPAAITGPALFCLAASGALPLDLLSLVMPDGFQIVRLPEEINHDEFEEVARDYLAAKARAHHPESEAGRDIGPKEKAALDGKVVALRAA